MTDASFTVLTTAYFERTLHLTARTAQIWRLLIAKPTGDAASAYPHIIESQAYSAEYGYPYTWLNAEMLKVITLLAKHAPEELGTTDLTRASAVVTLLTTEGESALTGLLRPVDCAGGALGQNGLFCHIAGAYNTAQHAALDQECLEALYYAYKNRAILGLNATQNAAILATIGNNDFWGDGANNTHLRVQPNQRTFRWHMNAGYYAADLGIAGATAFLTTCLANLATYLDTAPGVQDGINFANPSLNTDFSWWYAEESAETVSANWDSFEYPAMMLGGLLYYDQAVALGTTGITDATQLAQLKAFNRRMLGRWDLAGLPNWDTGAGSYRLWNTQYLGWSLRHLTMTAYTDTFNQHTKDGAIAKYVLDRSLELVARYDSWAGDPADSAISNSIFHLLAFSADGSHSTGAVANYGYDSQKCIANAFLCGEWMLAVEMGVADKPSYRPSMIKTYGWHTGLATISTPAYSVGMAMKSANPGTAEPLYANALPIRVFVNGYPIWLQSNADSGCHYFRILKGDSSGSYFSYSSFAADTMLQKALTQINTNPVTWNANTKTFTDYMVRPIPIEESHFQVITTDAYAHTAGRTETMTFTHDFYPGFFEQLITITPSDVTDDAANKVGLYLYIPIGRFGASAIEVNCDAVAKADGTATALYVGSTDVGATAITAANTEAQAYVHIYNGTRGYGLMIIPQMTDANWTDYDSNNGRKYNTAAAQFAAHNYAPDGACGLYVKFRSAGSSFLNTGWKWNAIYVPTDGSAAHADALYALFSSTGYLAALKARYINEQLTKALEP